MKETNRTRTREDAAVRRAQIVDEAIRLIGRLGSRGFTIQGLASQCGLSNAGLLYYFGSKDGVLLALIDEIERREADIVAPMIPTAAPDARENAKAYEAMVKLLRLIINRSCENPEVGRFVIVLQAEAMDPGHPAHDWFLARAHEAEDLFERVVAPWSGNARQASRSIHALILGLTRRWFDEPADFDLGATFESAVRALVPGPR